MGKEIISFGDIEVEKYKCHQRKIPISIGAVDFNKIIVSNKVAFGKKGFKYFIQYENDYEKVMPLRITLSTMSAYRRAFDEIKYIS